MEENNENVEPVVEETPVAPETPVVEAAPVAEPTPEPVSEPTPVEPVATEPTEKKKKGSPVLIIVIVLLLLVCAGVACVFLLGGNKPKEQKKEEKVVTDNKEKKSAYRLSGNGLENFDLYFLQLNNAGSNTVYSPLSIKYALAMLNEGTDGETKAQITALIGDYKPTKYINSKNMSFGNAFFVRDTFKDEVVPGTIDILKNKYSADVIVDPFTKPDTVNNWIKEKTLKLIDKLVTKEDLDELDFMIINALGIDMEWTANFIPSKNKAPGYTGYVSYDSMEYGWFGAENVIPGDFKGVKDKIATMSAYASYNNYDVVKAHGGESKYKNEIKEFYMKTCGQDEKSAKENAEETYKNITSNNNRLDKSTEFLFYVDDDVRVFAKDLKEYNGVQLQYVGFMPLKEDLKTFITNVKADRLSNYIKQLKEIKPENFEEGYITEVLGTIPKFKYEYSLDLKNDLKTLGVIDAFDSTKADLTKLVKGNATLTKAMHKANIEFTQDGIKASAATMLGGLGNAMSCPYVEKNLPIKKINITFDNPYMYIIRDKKTGEVWFTGSVYEPSPWAQDPDYYPLNTDEVPE